MVRLLFHLLLLTFTVLLAAACGSEDGGTTDIGAGAASDETPIPVEPDGGIGDETPIPVEPDGGIGDGAEPLPGAEVDAPTGDWHGADLATTNCPGVEFQRVEAAAFSFSVPTDFVDQQLDGIDSEFAVWSNGSIEASYDYGWYSGPVADLPGADVTAIDYSGFLGDLAVVAPGETEDGRGVVGVHFPLVEPGVQPNRLTLMVRFTDPAEEIIGRCIVGSIEWNVTPDN